MPVSLLQRSNGVIVNGVSQVIERTGVSQSAQLTELVIRRDTVVSGSLDVQ